MATVEGNLKALLEAAHELVPPVRSGQTAAASQDDVGSPFFTKTVALPVEYDPSNPNTVAPSWVYGLCVDKVEGGAVDDAVRVAFVTASQTFETIALVGQVIRFPRGARRVFLRGSVAGLTATVTWFLDRFADKRYSPKQEFTIPEPITVDGCVDLCHVETSTCEGGNAVVGSTSGTTELLLLGESTQDSAAIPGVISTTGTVAVIANPSTGGINPTPSSLQLTNAVVYTGHASRYQFGTGDFTVEGFFYRSSGDVIVQQLTGIGPYGTFTLYGWQLGFSAVGGNLYFRDSGNLPLIDGAVSWPVNTWHHIAVARKAGAISVYFDGTRIATGTATTDYSIGDTISVTAVAALFNDVRAIKGFAAYDGATITIPTPPLPSACPGNPPWTENDAVYPASGQYVIDPPSGTAGVASTLVLTPAAEWLGDITITGTDIHGDPITETITGPLTGPVETTQAFLSVTQLESDGDPELAGNSLSVDSGTTCVQIVPPTVAVSTVAVPLPSTELRSVSAPIFDPIAAVSTGTLSTLGCKFWGFILVNNHDTQAGWELTEPTTGVVLDTGNVPAGETRIIYYGPGISSPFPAATSGHSVVMPPEIVMSMVAGEATTGPNVIYWWSRY